MWFGHHFGNNPNDATLPQPPIVTTTAIGPATQVSVAVVPGGDKLSVESVHVWWINDNAFLWGSVPLKSQGQGIYAVPDDGRGRSQADPLFRRVWCRISGRPTPAYKSYWRTTHSSVTWPRSFSGSTAATIAQV